jgi:hypothetical protein
MARNKIPCLIVGLEQRFIKVNASRKTPTIVRSVCRNKCMARFYEAIEVGPLAKRTEYLRTTATQRPIGRYNSSGNALSVMKDTGL